MPFTVTANSPSAGSIAWTDVHIVYDGQDYTVANGNTSQKFVWWRKSTPNVFQVSNTHPSLTVDDAIVFLNKGGVPINVLNATATDGDLVVPGTVTATAIAADAITAEKIQTDAIISRHILAGAVTADKLTVNQLSAISANLGTMTAGNFTLDASGFIKGGATTFAAGNGFWMGYDSTTYKWRVGNPSGNRISWDGSSLEIVSTGLNISGGNATFTGAISGSQFTTGAMTGYAWPAVGQFGTYLGPSGLLIGNANNSKYFQVTSDGNIYAPGFSVTNGVLSISQANVINTLNIAGNAVSVSNFAQGNNSASTNLTIPSGVTATVFALLTKSVGAETSGGTPPTNLTLTINGVNFATSVWPVSRQTEFSGTLNAYDQAAVSGQVSVAGPATVTISASFPVSLANTLSLFAFARWK